MTTAGRERARHPRAMGGKSSKKKDGEEEDGKKEPKKDPNEEKVPRARARGA